MIYLDLKQNTPEWEEYRKTKMGASDIARLMTGNEQEVYSLYLEKKGWKKPFVTAAMQRGHDLEPSAISYFEIASGKDFPKHTSLSSKYDWLMASFDGYNENNNEVLEVKCLMNIPDRIEDHKDYKKFWWQVQAQMMVCGGYHAYLLYFSPEKQVSGTIASDASAFEQIAIKGKWMIDCINGSIEFPVPIIERYDNEWYDAAEAWKKAREKLEEAQELEAICRESMIYLAEDNSVVGNGVALTRVERRGTVDYSKIPELKSINLDAFRKPSSVTWRITPTS